MFLARRKNGNYFVEYYDEVEDKRKRVSTGTMNLEEAQLFLSNFIPDSNQNRASKSITISKFRHEYVEFIGSNHSKKYLSSINLAFDQLSKSIKNGPIEKISLRMAQQFVSETFKRTRHGAYLYCRTLKAAFNIAVEWNYIEVNPFKKVRLPKIERSAPLFISEEELTKIIAKTIKREYKDLFFLGFHTGMRLGELINLKWSAVNLDSRMITVKNTEDFCTKSKRERIVPINQKLYSMLSNKITLEREFDVNDYLFRKCKNVKLDGEYASHMFKVVVRSLKLNDKIHFHTLRHSFASNLIQKGASIYVVKELLGHSDITTTQIYSHLRTEDLIASINLLNS